MRYYLGWDVGGWNCDANSRSRDALCVLRSEDGDPILNGSPWRGNLRSKLNNLKGPELMQAMLRCCEVEVDEPFEVVLAIDTPLGWPRSAVRLFTGGYIADVPEEFHQNPYLFRETERFLSAHGFRPLSSVKDMIGSQSTKGLHFLRAARSQAVEVGIWESRQEGTRIVALETYPSPCKESEKFQQLFYEVEQTNDFQRRIRARGEAYREDVCDALRCAVVAWLHAELNQCLAPPVQDACLEEGWIWVPQDALDRR